MIEFVLEHPMEFDAFQLENERTREVLHLERHAHYRQYKLYRCPRGERHQWLEEASEVFCEPTTIYYRYDEQGDR